MKLIKYLDFGRVKAYELGYVPIGQPIITTHIYFVDSIMIDTGQKYLRREVKDLVTANPIQRVLLTHHHEDHSGNAAMIAEVLKVPIHGNPLTIQKMETHFKIFPYQQLVWGSADPVEVLPLPEVIETDAYQFKPIHTPGHSKDHTVYWEKNQGWLFSGDMYLGDRAKYFRADERIKDEIQSLKKVLELDFETVFCAHSPRIKEGKQGLIRKLDFLEDLYGNVEKLHNQGIGIGKIMQKLKIKESYVLMFFCFGNLSARNMIKSVINSLNEES